MGADGRPRGSRARRPTLDPRAEGQKARETARTAEQFARESSESSVKEVAEAKKRLAAAERARSTLRAELNTVREELVAERSQHIAACDEYEQKLLERSKAHHAHRPVSSSWCRGSAQSWRRSCVCCARN